MSALGTTSHPLRVAVIGAGPSGFYSAEALLKAEPVVEVDMIDRLPSPYGLVRSGVAPDHPKLKNAINTYEKIAEMPGFSFAGNITVGRDVSVADLRRTHHAVIFTCGAETDRRLGIPGEELRGSHTATEFVGWYNAHPDYHDRSFDLSCDTAVVIGQGNVAADVSRILSKTADELRRTDIAEHALEVLAESRIRNVFVIGRRGPAQAKFTSKELKEFATLGDCQAKVDPAQLELNAESRAELEHKLNAGSLRNYELFREFASAPESGKSRRCRFEFLLSPVEIRGEGRIEAVVLERNRLEGAPFDQRAVGCGELRELPCGILFRSIGYRGVAIEGVPFDAKRGVFPSDRGRILDAAGARVPGLYAAGWIKRGPTGIIGTNRADAVETVDSLLHDLAALEQGEKAGLGGLAPLLAARGIRTVSFADWTRIDAREIERGSPRGKPREKFPRVAEMLAVLDD
jgi:ferredoxin--NADP+ reductase